MSCPGGGQPPLFLLFQLKRFSLFLESLIYEYFITNIGAAPFKGSGSSVKKQAGNSGQNGMAYRVYGCGIKAEEHRFNSKNQQHSIIKASKKRLIVALESIIVLPK